MGKSFEDVERAAFRAGFLCLEEYPEETGDQETVIEMMFQQYLEDRRKFPATQGAI